MIHHLNVTFFAYNFFQFLIFSLHATTKSTDLQSVVAQISAAAVELVAVCIPHPIHGPVEVNNEK